MSEEKCTEWLSPLQFMERFNVGKNTIYRALQTDRLPHVRIGKRYWIPADALNRMISERGIYRAPSSPLQRATFSAPPK